MPHQPLKLIYIDKQYIVPNTFSTNLMIIITGTFKNTSNPLKLDEITLFNTGLLAYYSESTESSLS